jgi:hypothetical protein
MAHEGYHESADLLKPETRDMHRALISLIEELEAVDWYQQRADACDDDDLRAVLVHNKDEEVEHAAMTLEWIRRKASGFDKNLRTYLFTSVPITEVEEAVDDGEPAAEAVVTPGGSRGPGGGATAAASSVRSSHGGAASGPTPQPAGAGSSPGSLGIGSLKAT